MSNSGNTLTDIVEYLNKLSDHVITNSKGLIKLNEFLQSFLQSISESFDTITSTIDSIAGIVIENADRLDVLEMMIDSQRELIKLQTQILDILSNVVIFLVGLGVFNTFAIIILAYFVFFGKKEKK